MLPAARPFPIDKAAGALLALGGLSACATYYVPAGAGRAAGIATVTRALSDAGLARFTADMDPAMLALARRHDPRPHKDFWGRVQGWEVVDVRAVPRLGDRDPDFDEARAINAYKPAAPLDVEPARPFMLSGPASERAKALHCMTQAVYYEAGFEPVAGQQAVAQAVLNRVRHPGYPKSVCGVVYEGASRPTGCQFSFTCDGSLQRAVSPAVWSNAEIVARRALAGFVMKDVGTATHYHADYVYPYWAPTLVKLRTVGTHVFYRWTGLAGRLSAFRGRYSANETVSTDILMGADPRTLEAAPPGMLAALAASGGVLPVATGEQARIVSAEGVVEVLPPMTGDPAAAMRGGRRLPTPDEIAKINKALGALETPVVDTTVKPVETAPPPQLPAPPPPPPKPRPPSLLNPLN